MPIPFRCPACDNLLHAAGRLAGQEVTCPACNAKVTVPADPAGARHRSPDAKEPEPQAQEPAPADGPPRSRNPVRVGLLLAVVFGLGGLTAFAFRGKESPTQPPPAPPGDRSDAQSATVAVPQTERRANEGEAPKHLPVEIPPAARTVQANAPSPNPQTPTAREGTKPAVQRAVVSRAPGTVRPPVAHDRVQPAGPAARPLAPPPDQDRPKTLRERWASKRRSRLTDDELRVQLLQAPEVDLNAVPGTTDYVISHSPRAAARGFDVIPPLAAQRADLLGLPLHEGLQARIGPEEALNLKVLSQRLRLQVQSSIRGNTGTIVDPRPDPDLLRERLLASPLRDLWLRPQAIGTLRQLLMPEHRNVRLILVELLSRIEGRLASMALAERAIFDLDPDVRLAALTALKSRPHHEYEATLVAGLRYPWPAFADHAAEALVTLELRETVPQLIPLLDARDRSEPSVAYQGKTRRAVVPELVRINHLRNCLLCHAYSTSPLDPVRGLVPNAEHLVPLPSSGSRTGGWGGGGNESTLSVVKQTFVRADINFLRQDFSVIQPVAKHGRLWPADQRYDYVVRLRPLGARQLLAWQDEVPHSWLAQPQRDALLFALRELTGENPGPSVEDWKRHYSTLTGQRFPKPLAPADQVLHLRDCLVQASPLKQAELLTTFRDKRGAAYDTAVALALPQMNSRLQKSARSLLVDRLFCLPVKTLREKFADENMEVRRAAVKVCGLRKLRALVPELITLLDGGDETLTQQVREVLQRFASRNFGPRRGADSQQRQEAIAAWRQWWDKENEKRAARERHAS